MGIHETLLALKDGESMEYGELCGGLDSDTPIVWDLLETLDTPEGRRMTFHLYWHEVFFGTLVLLVKADGSIVEVQSADKKYRKGVLA